MSRIEFVSGPRGEIAFDQEALVELLTGFSSNLSRLVDVRSLVEKVVQSGKSRMTENELSTLLSESAAFSCTTHPDYGLLAGRVMLRQLRASVNPNFVEALQTLLDNRHFKTGEPQPLILGSIVDFARRHEGALQGALKPDRDLDFDFNALRVFSRSYLLWSHTRGGRKTLETPQHMYLRVALGIHVPRLETVGEERTLERVLELYEYMSSRKYTHASPTLFNAGTPKGQLASCFLMTVEDNLVSIEEGWRRQAEISRHAGGIGCDFSDIRAKGSAIAGNGESSGILPLLRVHNSLARYVDQGGGKRKGALAAYLEPWHADIACFLELKRQHGDEEERCRDLFTGLWVPDLFMKRCQTYVNLLKTEPRLQEALRGEPGLEELRARVSWSLFCPAEVRGYLKNWSPEERLALARGRLNEDQTRALLALETLTNACGAVFDLVYEHLEGVRIQTPDGEIPLARSQIPAYKLMERVADMQIETGVPYVLFKDAANESSMQNLGTLRCSNLCTEILEYVSQDEVAVCNLASLNLPQFVVGGSFDFESLEETVRVAVRNLNAVIDVTYYPVEAARRSNLRHRPVGLGVQGLQEAFIKLGLPFESEGARILNAHIFECIYRAALLESSALAAIEGPYETFHLNPAARGVLHMDLFEAHARSLRPWGSRFEAPVPRKYGDWDRVREVCRLGLRNSLLVAPMPTASTSILFGNTESFEPLHSLAYARRVLAGDLQEVNRQLVEALEARGLWTEQIGQDIVANRGSIQGLSLPEDIKALFKTVWEIPQRVLFQMAADRGAFIDQSASLNLHLPDPTVSKVISALFYAWSRGVKTGMYYLRSQPKANPIQFTVDKETRQRVDAQLQSQEPACESCSA